jgi:ribosomal protein S27AE
MTHDTTCPKCGSPMLIDDVRIIEGMHEQGVEAAVYKRPRAMVFKGTVATPLCARVCGSCGHVELFVANPQALLQAASNRTER